MTILIFDEKIFKLKGVFLMKSKYKIPTIIVILSIAIFLHGCEESRSGGSGTIDLARGEPNIVESVLAISVFEDRPDGITDTFDPESDKQVYLWLLWENINKTHRVKIDWYSPSDGVDDPPFWSEEKRISSTTGEKITWFFIDAPKGGLSFDRFESGYWTVDIYLDDLFERSHFFFME